MNWLLKSILFTKPNVTNHNLPIFFSAWINSLTLALRLNTARLISAPGYCSRFYFLSILFSMWAMVLHALQLCYHRGTELKVNTGGVGYCLYLYVKGQIGLSNVAVNGLKTYSQMTSEHNASPKYDHELLATCTSTYIKWTLLAAHKKTLLRDHLDVRVKCLFRWLERFFGQSLLLFQSAVLLSLSSQLAHPHILARHVWIHHCRWEGRRNAGNQRMKSKINTWYEMSKHSNVFTSSIFSTD